MPPSCTDPVSRGCAGSLTSYCLSSPMPQHDTYSCWSSTERLMSVISGGTAPNGFSAGGRASASADCAGIVITFSAAQLPPSRCQRHTEADRSWVDTTTPTNPQVASGSCAGRNSSTIWCSAPRSTRWRCLPAARSQKCSAWPYLLPNSSSGLTPSSIIDGVPHSLVTTVLCCRCHQASYARYCGPRSLSQGPSTSKVEWSSSAIPPGPSAPSAPPKQDRKIPSGPQCRVCGRE